jgi:biopolymer transport protein TolR
MSISLDASGTKRGRGKWKPKAEINVTPFVDIMLVLLIVFMVTAVAPTIGVAVDLPETEARALPISEEPLIITIDIEGQIYLQETVVTLEELGPRLTAIAGTGYDSRIFIRADDAASYGDVARVMAHVNASGFRNLGLITDPLDP